MENTIRFAVDVQKINSQYLYSDKVNIGGRKWCLAIKKKFIEARTFLSVFVYCIDLTDADALDANFELRIISQNNARKPYKHAWRESLLCRSLCMRGWHEFIKWEDFAKPTRGYIVNSQAIIEGEISIVYNYDAQSLVHFRKKIELADCVLKFTNGKRLRAISTKLGEKSSYFAIRLDKAKDVEIESDYEDMIFLLNLLHGNQLIFGPHDYTSEDADSFAKCLLKMSIKYDCAVEIQQCEKYIIESTTIPMIQKLKYADHYGLERLKKCCLSQLTKVQTKQLMNHRLYQSLSNEMRLAIMEQSLKCNDDDSNNLNLEEYQIIGKVRDFKNQRGWLTDDTVKVNGTVFHISRQILLYEFKLYEHCKAKENVEISDDEFNVFDEFLQMIYQLTNPVTNSTYVPLMKLALRFEAYTILRKCENFVIYNPNIPLIDKLIFAGEQKMNALANHAVSQVTSFDELRQLTQHPRFNLVSESIVGKITLRLLSI